MSDEYELARMAAESELLSVARKVALAIDVPGGLEACAVGDVLVDYLLGNISIPETIAELEALT